MPVPKASDLEQVLLQATSPRGCAALLETLGVPHRLERLSREEWAELRIERAAVADIRACAESGFLALFARLRTRLDPPAVASFARAVRNATSQQSMLLLVVGAEYERVALATFGIGGELRQIVVDRTGARASDIDALREMIAEPGEGPTALAVRHARALDRSRLTRQFYAEFRARRVLIARGWQGLPAAAGAEREQLALLLLSRVMFLYFLQRSEQLAGDREYMLHLLQRWQREESAGTFFTRVLQPLFFGALNCRFESRSAAARALGALPYLNGGLFDRHPLEKRYARLDLPDAHSAGAIQELFERYRFTAGEARAGELDRGIDPEMLGRVFEGLMQPDRRGLTGTFFTPARVVERIVERALACRISAVLGVSLDQAVCILASPKTDEQDSVLDEAQRTRLGAELERMRVLDPACGSGAFLLGALDRLARLQQALGRDHGSTRRFIGESLFGVDVQHDAAQLCALRLWLTLLPSDDSAEIRAGASIAPLPNLDRHVRQGDALVDPLALAYGPGMQTSTGWIARGALETRRAARALEPLAHAYTSAQPEEKAQLRRALTRAELRLAFRWIDAAFAALQPRLAELRAHAKARDLFGGAPADAHVARARCADLTAQLRELTSLRAQLRQRRGLPFFSFAVHFAGPMDGFDMVLSNPPWVRAHRWPASVARTLRARYRVCGGAGNSRAVPAVAWPGQPTASISAKARSAGQVDLSLLFLERSLELLRPGGALGMLLPAKSMRSAYGASARRMLLRETHVGYLEDHSLDQRSIFRADAFAAAVVATKRQVDGPPEGMVRVEMIRRGVPPLAFELPAMHLPVDVRDDGAPWLIAPPAVRDVLRRMQQRARTLGESGLRIRRGVFTGADDVMLFERADAKLAGLSRIRPQSDVAGAYVETDALRRAVRGRDIDAWRYSSARHVLWLYDDSSAAPLQAPPRAARYLARHAALLERRTGWSTALQRGAVFRVTADVLQPKVAWQDLAETLNAVALPARVRCDDGAERALVPLNTVYFIPLGSVDSANTLAAYMNSLPVRTFARCIAERAKDARFRFFAATVAMIPLPAGWHDGTRADCLLEISRCAHQNGGLEAEACKELDRLVADAYGLSVEPDLATLSVFDSWLRGRAS
jgi:hypothetical protein